MGRAAHHARRHFETLGGTWDTAAADIANESGGIRRDVLASPDTDPRLLPLLRRAIAELERIAS